MDIEQLLEQYFEGRTSAEDEAVLRRFFTTGDVPNHLRMYKPLFAYFENVRNKSDGTSKNNKRIILWLSGVAACAAIFVGTFFYTSQTKKCPASGNYVMIDGRCYTDAATIRSITIKTLHEVSEGDAFFPDDNTLNIINIVENQLKEFDFLLDE